jgi:hypothetical protein
MVYRPTSSVNDLLSVISSTVDDVATASRFSETAIEVGRPSILIFPAIA